MFYGLIYDLLEEYEENYKYHTSPLNVLMKILA